jgi:hypothetical protein
LPKVQQFLRWGSKGDAIMLRTARILTLTAVLLLLLLSHAFGAQRKWPWPFDSSGQPTQISSKVDYNLNLSDPFFQTEEWSDSCSENDKESRYKRTARCVGSHQGEHTIDFCRAKLLDDNAIELIIHDAYDLCPSAADDNLKIVIQNGQFWSQYWTFYKHLASNFGLIWTTKRQELTLDKKVYHKGDVIKGRIDFECVQENGDPELVEKYGRNPYSITLKGVFKTILK